MPDSQQVFPSFVMDSQEGPPRSEPCIMVIFGASGDLTKRLLVPALYNLACDGLLPDELRHARHRHGRADDRRSSASG